jgi:Retrotransposon gag protein/Zinc knuckle
MGGQQYFFNTGYQPPAQHQGNVNQNNPTFPMPKYIGRGDPKSASDFIQAVICYAYSIGRSPVSLLDTHMHIMLTQGAFKWWGLYNDTIRTWEDFTRAFLATYASVTYGTRLLAELRNRTQDPDEPLTDYIANIAEYYNRIGGNVSEQEKIQTILDQIHPEYRPYTFGKHYNTLVELAQDANHIQEAVLQSKMYLPPPPPEQCIEPSLAFNSRFSGHVSALQRGVGQLQQNTETSAKVSVSALDPIRARMQQVTLEPKKQTKKVVTKKPSNPEEPFLCYRCSGVGHMAKNCPNPPTTQSKNE